MQELNQTFFSALRLAKVFFDSNVSDEAKKDLGIWELNEDNCYVLGLVASEWIFQNTGHYYNDKKEIDTWLFADPIIDKFCQLCQEYERTKGISEEANSYRYTIEQTIHENFNFDSYCYDYNWRLSPNDRGRKCILLFTGEEFYSQESVPEGLLEIRETFLMLNQKLEAELSKENGMIPLSPTTGAQWKEAA